MSEATYAGFKDWPSIPKNNWPPTEDKIIDIASNALNISQDKDVKVFIYSDNIDEIIFDEIDIKNERYIKKEYYNHERKVEVIVIKKN